MKRSLEFVLWCVVSSSCFLAAFILGVQRNLYAAAAGFVALFLLGVVTFHRALMTLKTTSSTREQREDIHDTEHIKKRSDETSLRFF